MFSKAAGLKTYAKISVAIFFFKILCYLVKVIWCVFDQSLRHFYAPLEENIAVLLSLLFYIALLSLQLIHVLCLFSALAFLRLPFR